MQADLNMRREAAAMHPAGANPARSAANAGAATSGPESRSAGTPGALLKVQHIAKALGEGAMRNPIIGDLSFEALEGEFLSIVGPSGCGKTTLLMCLAGLYRVDSGTVEFGGKPVDGPPAGVSVVFQDYSRSLLPWKNNLQNVVFGMKRVHDMSRADKLAYAHELLANVGLKGFERHYPWQVSGGMQQRIAIARGLAARSQLLLLDEPLAAVDAQTRADIQDLLLDLARRYKQTCVLVTHDVDEAVYMADRIVVLSKRPTVVAQQIKVSLARPRTQLETREEREFLDLRHQVVTLIQSMRTPH
ncbi:ABC transporter ATP-binding protein [Paraburkholderia pallida]|nr:ABC transporter ATP-binding protein [Paraburkholderia pallida]